MREHWEGLSLPGNYRLEKWLGGDAAAGSFEASLPGDNRRALVKLVPESAGYAAARFAIWQRARSLRHPNLRELLDCGRAELAGQIVFYGVFEYADDSLGDALDRAPLSEAEARDVLAAVADALAYLQVHGLAHCQIDADHVIAVGDQIKLSTDALREVPAGTPYTGELRAFWNKISPCTPERSADILAGILSVQDAGAHPSSGTVPGAGPASAGIAPIPDVPVPDVMISDVAVQRDLPGTAPPAPTAPVPAVPTAYDFTPPPPNRFPKWIFVGAAAVVLLILGLNFRRSPEAPPTVPARAAAPAVASPVPQAKSVAAPEAPQQPAPTRASAPAAALPGPQASPVADAVSKPSDQSDQAGKSMWRVIAYTYRSHDAAAKKARQVNQRHPDLQAAVFSPGQTQDYYLVSLGGRMSRDEAVRLQKKAWAEGLARDVYVQNYVE